MSTQIDHLKIDKNKSILDGRHLVFHWDLDLESKAKAMKEIQAALKAFKKTGTINY